MAWVVLLKCFHHDLSAAIVTLVKIALEKLIVSGYFKEHFNLTIHEEVTLVTE